MLPTKQGPMCYFTPFIITYMSVLLVELSYYSYKLVDEMSLRIVLFLSQLSLCWYLQATSLTDTISPTQPLKDGQILTSTQGNTFAFGFFSLGNSTQRRYVGIWYNKVAVQTVVWVANRDDPINGTDGILSIADDGNLLLSSHNSTVWSTHHQISNYKQRHPIEDPPKAQLLDSGNLVLVFGKRQTSSRVWQSFDHPTHVFLPGMMLGLDRRTGFSRFLSSWRSSEDPGHGNYTFGMAHPGGGSPEFFMYRDGSVPVWRTGPWVGDRWSGVPEMTRSYIFNYTFVDTADQVYATYKILNASIVSMFVLDGESGTVQRKTWHQRSGQWIKFWAVPQEDCDEYAHCGAFGLCNPNSDEFRCSCFPGYEPKSPRDWYLRDGSEGCVRAGNVSECRNGEGFLKMGNLKVPDTSTAKTNLSMNLGECRQECLNNCSCVAFTTATDAAATSTTVTPVGCILFHAHLMDTRVYDASGGQDLYIRVDADELVKSLNLSKDNFNKKRLVILVVGTILSLTFLICVACLLYWRNMKEYFKEQEERNLWLGEAGQINSDSSSPVFCFSTIAAATKNFDASSFLGEGGFGPVYKGKLSSGHEIAVKRLSKNSGQGIDEFKNEVRLISKLQHKNLVKILGCCIRGEEKMLIYEFLPNKSLAQNIFEEKKTLLDWSKRYEIIIGIARGVLYLHQDSRLKIIHRDLKASNILLDAEMNPKISDFGTARIFGNNQSEANTNRVVGTYGYMSPEYAMEGLFSMKSDVFSYGVILIEIISGQRSSGYYNDRLSTNLSGYVWKLWKDGNVMEIVDKSIVSSLCDFEDEIRRCIQIGLLCVQENPNERPTMLEVTFMLSNKSQLPDPNEPTFITKGNHYDGSDPISSSYGTQSVNGLTISMVNAR